MRIKKHGLPEAGNPGGEGEEEMILSDKKKKITNAKELTEIMRLILKSEDEIDRAKEHCWAVGVNQKNVIQYIELVSLGTLNASLVHPREVFRLAIMKGVANIFLVHNHPSGEVYPSKEDDLITSRINEAGKIICIKLMDHIIINEPNEEYYSYSSMGKIN